MVFNRNRIAIMPFVLALLLSVLSASLFGQSLIAGDIAGHVSDSSNAVIAGAVVNLQSLDTGATQSTKSNVQGAYRFSLLKPGSYKITITAPGFAAFAEKATVVVGQITTADAVLKVTGTSTVVEVTDATPLITVDPGSTTSFSKQDLEMLPSAGGDITNIATTAPGAVANTAGGGYGNFTVNGLPATSNLFTVNGEDNMDPYFNVNNSGATNLTLGQNEVSEAAVITNAYSGQYGQLSGAQVTYVTKSGSNNYHGNAVYWWNGRTLNANDWMNKNEGGERPFSNNNQWATSVGGPVIKNRTFFFVDYEGTRFVLPGGGSTIVPTTAFANAVLNNLTTAYPAEKAMYSKMFDLYAAAAKGKTLNPYAFSGCASAIMPGFTPNTNHDNCASLFSSNPTTLASEWILAGRIDQRISDKDNIYGRYKLDHGTQPTYIDQINSNFNAISKQPSYDIQVSETHLLNPHSTNQLMVTGSHYVAQFQQNQPLANNTFPYRVTNVSTVPFTSFNPESSFPQGRNVTQWQVIDDYTLSVGKHDLKFGGNFRRYLVSDHNFFYNYPRVYFGYTGGMTNFINGLGYAYSQSDNLASDVLVKMYGLGLYAQDEWAVNSKMKLTLALRAERNGNPSCLDRCFANFVSDWSTLPSTAAGANSGNIAYNQDIKTNLKNPFTKTDPINVSPRVGFSYSPDHKTVISGGFGLFYDGLPSGLLDDLTANPPVTVHLLVKPTAGTPVFDAGTTGSAYTWKQSALAFKSGFAAGSTYTQIYNSLLPYGVKFAAPSITSLVGDFHAPHYYEWNFQVQREVLKGTAVVINYVGNKGGNVPYSSAWPNAYDEYNTYSSALIPQGVPPNSNYGTVTQWKSGAISSYNGLNVSLRHQFSKQLSVHANYTWGHALDEVSNGGAFAYSSESIGGQINPTSLRKYNYGNSDYDIRQNFNIDWTYSPRFHLDSRLLSQVVNGWEWSGKAFYRAGLPFSVVDGNFAYGNGGGTVMAQPLAGQRQFASCGASDAGVSPTSSCLLQSGFFNTNDGANYSAFSTQARNQYRGPHYIDFDMALNKTFKLHEGVNLGLGALAFNVFNHPNFGLPNYDVSSGSAFGQITSMAVLPTTPYGAGLGYASEARLLQLTAKITF